MRKQLLIVDDSNDVLEILQKRVDANTWIVVLAENVQDAITKIQNSDFDLVVTDFNMPDGTGEDVRKALVELKKQARVFLHTADSYNFSDEFERCFMKFDLKLLRILAGKEEEERVAA